MTDNQASLARAGLSASQATSTVSISPILGKGDIVTGVRGTTDGNVILTGSHATGTKEDALPFLYQGPLTSAAKGISALTPPRRLAFVRPGDVVSHRCRGKPAVFSRRLHGDREHCVPEPGDGALRV